MGFMNTNLENNNSMSSNISINGSRTTSINSSMSNARATTVSSLVENGRATAVSSAMGNNRATAVSSAMGNDRATEVGLDFDTSRSTQMHGSAVSGNIPIGDTVEGYTVTGYVNAVSGQSVVHIVEKSGKKFALKLYKNEDTCIDRAVVKLLMEDVNDPAVVRVVDDGEYNGRYYTVTPFFDEGAVIDHLDEIDSKLLKKYYIPQLNEALNAIHKAGMFHCDIKPHNFYFNNDRKSIVIGDFGIALSKENNVVKKAELGMYIPKRELQKNAGTSAYLSKEGDEYAASWVDYYALGMSILNMAHGRDVYEDVDDNTIRDELMNNSVRIPDNVDPEVAALVLKLLEGDNLRRIGYEGVKKWCEDNSCYGKYRKNTDVTCTVHIDSAVLNGNVINSTEDYVNYLQDNWKWGLEYYNKDGIVNDVARIPDVDRDYIKALSELKQKNKNAEIGYMLTLMKLNPSAPFIYSDERFGDFSGYISYLSKNQKALAGAFYNEAVIITQIKNESVKRGKDKTDGIISKVKSVFECSDFTRENKMEMLRNYFCGKNDVLLNGKKYSSVNELAKLMFDDKMEPIPNNVIFNRAFFGYMTSVFSNIAEFSDILNGLLTTKDIFKRNASFSKLLTGQVRFKINGYEFGSMVECIAYAKNLYEQSNNCGKFVELLRNGKLHAYYLCEEDYNKDFADFLMRFKGLTKDIITDHELLSYFYNYTQENAVFIYDGLCISNLQDLFTHLGNVKDIASETHNLLDLLEFNFWLEGCGYEGILENIVQ